MKRLVALGRKYPKYDTQYVVYMPDPIWDPQPDPNGSTIDHDESRKRAIEEREDTL